MSTDDKREFRVSGKKYSCECGLGGGAYAQAHLLADGRVLLKTTQLDVTRRALCKLSRLNNPYLPQLEYVGYRYRERDAYDDPKKPTRREYFYLMPLYSEVEKNSYAEKTCRKIEIVCARLSNRLSVQLVRTVLGVMFPRDTPLQEAVFELWKIKRKYDAEWDLHLANFSLDENDHIIIRDPLAG